MSVQFINSSEVKLLSVSGSEQTILDAARISYKSNEAKKSTADQDKKLLRYLLKNKHTSPFEQVSMQFYIDTPLFVIQQLLRHRTFKFNQTSARYSEMEPRFFIPEPRNICEQSSDNKQGRESKSMEGASSMYVLMMHAATTAYDNYCELLDNKVAKEIARNVLPVSLMSQLVVSCDLRNLIHFLNLRLDPHAQLEIREVAIKMLKLVEAKFPVTFEYLKETDNVFKQA